MTGLPPDPIPFGARHASALRWRYGTGDARLSPRSVGVPDSGVVGSGNSTGMPKAPDPAALVRFGHVDSALHKVGSPHAEVLALAYGAEGSKATEAGMYPSRLWRALAPCTAAAHKGAEKWLDKQATASLKAFGKGKRGKAAKGTPATETPPAPPPPRPSAQERHDEGRKLHTPRAPLWKGDGGPGVLRWLSYVLDPKASPPPSDADKARLPDIEAQAWALLHAAELAFAQVFVPRAYEDERERGEDQ